MNETDMITKKIFHDIKDLLINKENIIFALVFGSSISGKDNQLSDIDIGIFCKNKFELIELGKVISALEKITNRKVDLIELNDLYKKSPLLAYEIVTHSRVLFSKNDEVLIDFKRKAFLHYFDTAQLRKLVQNSLYKRITNKKLGKRNYG